MNEELTITMTFDQWLAVIAGDDPDAVVSLNDKLQQALAARDGGAPADPTRSSERGNHDL